MNDLRPIHIIETEAYFLRHSVTDKPWSEWEILPVDCTNYNLNICCKKAVSLFAVKMRNKLTNYTFQIPNKCLLALNPSFAVYVSDEQKRRRKQRRQDKLDQQFRVDNPWEFVYKYKPIPEVNLTV